MYYTDYYILLIFAQLYNTIYSTINIYRMSLYQYFIKNNINMVKSRFIYIYINLFVYYNITLSII